MIYTSHAVISGEFHCQSSLKHPIISSIAILVRMHILLILQNMVKVPFARVNSRDILCSMLINNCHSILKTRMLVAGLIHLVFYYKFFSNVCK